jgi:hypothetical protein
MTSWAQRARSHFQQERDNSTTETTETPLSVVLKVQSGRFSEKRDLQNQVGLAANDLEANELANDPDRYCWPHSTAMNSLEIELFAARRRGFIHRGIHNTDAEVLADKLVFRDRDSDDRAACLECTHLSGGRQSGWHCGNGKVAGVATRARDVQLPADLVLQLQRCEGFDQLHRTAP